MATRSSGGMRFRSKLYLTKKANPRNSANPPIQANSFTPMNCSQLNSGSDGSAGSVGFDAGAAAEGSLTIASAFGRTIPIARGSCGGSGGGIIITGAAIASSTSNCSGTPTDLAAGDSGLAHASGASTVDLEDGERVGEKPSADLLVSNTSTRRRSTTTSASRS